MSTRQVRGACPMDCPDTCSWIVTVEHGVAVNLEGDREHPFTHGALCNKLNNYLEYTRSADRLLYPMRRVGKKGEGKFERITWEQALDEIAHRLQPIAARDPQAILPYSYCGTMGLVQGEAMAMRFFNTLGASLLDRTVCANAGPSFS